MARERIEKFIRRHAPKGSPEALSSPELRDMNERRLSTQRFDPYTPSPHTSGSN